MGRGASGDAAESASGLYSSWLTRIVQDIAQSPETPAQPRPRVGERIGNDRFELLAEIGAGAMGLVFRGLDRKLKRAVAIKLLLPHRDGPGSHNEDLLTQEAQAVASL